LRPEQVWRTPVAVRPDCRTCALSAGTRAA
jgi:hypothetical protein